MTQIPGSSEPSQEPTAPTYSSYPAPPAQPGTPPPPPGVPTYAAPPSYTSGPAPQAPRKRRRFGVLGGGIAVIAVIAVKIALAVGAGSLFHHVEHREGDAENVVKAALQADTGAEFMANVEPGLPIKSVIDPSCQDVLSGGGMFKIPKSRKESDGSADVEVDFDSSSKNGHFHLVDDGGWKIDHVTCS